MRDITERSCSSLGQPRVRLWMLHNGIANPNIFIYRNYMSRDLLDMMLIIQPAASGKNYMAETTLFS